MRRIIILSIFLISQALFGQLDSLVNTYSLNGSKLLEDSIFRIDSIINQKFSIYKNLDIDSDQIKSILSETEEKWYQLSEYQLLRLILISNKYKWPSDSLIKIIHGKKSGYSRDSLILWLEEGGIAGDERKRMKLIESNQYQIITEAYNYFGNISEIDLSLRWYAIVISDEGITNIFNVNPQIILSQFPLNPGELEFDIRHNRDFGSHFLFGCPIAIDTGYIGVNDPSIPSFYPGKSFTLFQNNNTERLTLNAMGSVLSNGICGSIENYSLIVTISPDVEENNDLFQDIGPSLVDTMNNCVPELFWYGDLLGDKISDALFLQKIDNGLRLILFLSDPSPQDKIWIKSAEWILLNKPLKEESLSY